jgi:hypothetical protein
MAWLKRELDAWEREDGLTARYIGVGMEKSGFVVAEEAEPCRRDAQGEQCGSEASIQAELLALFELERRKAGGRYGADGRLEDA